MSKNFVTKPPFNRRSKVQLLLPTCYMPYLDACQNFFYSFIHFNLFYALCREVLHLKDGGEVALDWLTNGCSDDAPIIIILPGLTGESQAEYIKCLVTEANQKGMRCVVFNNRGLGGMILKTPRLYCAANCEDLSEVVNHVHQKYPSVKKGATGISMGGLILGNKITSFFYKMNVDQMLTYLCF